MNIVRIQLEFTPGMNCSIIGGSCKQLFCDFSSLVTVLVTTGLAATAEKKPKQPGECRSWNNVTGSFSNSVLI